MDDLVGINDGTKKLPFSEVEIGAAFRFAGRVYTKQTAVSAEDYEAQDQRQFGATTEVELMSLKKGW